MSCEQNKAVFCSGCPERGSFQGPVEEGRAIINLSKVQDFSVRFEDKTGGLSHTLTVEFPYVLHDANGKPVSADDLNTTKAVEGLRPASVALQRLIANRAEVCDRGSNPSGQECTALSLSVLRFFLKSNS